MAPLSDWGLDDLQPVFQEKLVHEVTAVVLVVQGLPICGDEAVDFLEHLFLCAFTCRVLALLVILIFVQAVLVVVEDQSGIASVQVHFIEDGLEVRIIRVTQGMPEELDDVGLAAWLLAYIGMDQFGLATLAQCHEPIGLGELYETWIIGVIGVDAVAVNAENDVPAMYVPVDVDEGRWGLMP